ncbi:MAG: glycoside hydrolase family 3 protein [Phaeodactylibacter xiamenensis]|uniref:beta-glucosidase n=1 Tax=Phaeodactylibacter xiamenensis TaxID=1524460 RepID=A0A098S657_9BACT|nr:glycoside hydrolase family 3 N-terminal domain-containing protein [Phaeodactylibacter xiamenensis]KGE87595.1 beta-glucosidase [Phaeodactylibacter xiamenensis]MCR9052408.1 glycoside hydrolase family 3 C-terminal domain-containing protein [bacterium]
MRVFLNYALLLSIVATWGCQSEPGMSEKTIPALALEKTTLKAEADGTTFRDLNKNGNLDPYEDINAPIEERVEDLLSQMTVEEKAGLLFMPGVGVNEDGSLEKSDKAKGPGARYPAAIENIDNGKLNHFNVWTIPEDPKMMAVWYNNLQAYAEKSRLGIPVTIASDPRHHFSNTIFSMAADGFTQFCETPGLAAIGNDSLVEAFANIVREEYLAVGLRVALHPQIDLATEPRWSRISGTFGEDAALSARMVTAYIKGLQGESLNERSIACMTKHFPGGGPQKEGLDPHFAIQKGQIYPGENFDYHLIPFEAAFKMNTASIMPYYGIPTGQTDEDVAMAYNKAIITDLLRNKYQYDGVVCTDWGLLTDVPMGPDVIWPARAWGAEHLSEAERVQKIIDAGCDQFGGENCPELVLQLVEAGKLSEERIDESARRLLRQKFQLGLFDNPFVDETQVGERIGKPDYRKLGDVSQQMAMTLLKNEAGTLPLQPNVHKVYIEGMDSSVVARYATVVDSPEEADFAILRLNTPWYPADTKNPFALSFHHGDLNFQGKEQARLMELMGKVPTIVDIYLDRPAVIPDIAGASKALIADFGASDQNVCEVLFGNARPQGKLPFELPSSMEAVRNQLTDVPYDSEDPLYKFGYGLNYK